jgi:hypothetical protein
LNALATALPIEEIIHEEIRESSRDRRARLELERYNLIFRAKAEAGRQALDKALRTAYPDRIPPIPDTLKGQRLSPLATRLERTSPLTRFEHLSPVFDGLPWLVDDVTAFPYPRGTRERIPWDLRRWVNNQTHNSTDQNLFNDARYARDKMQIAYANNSAGAPDWDLQVLATAACYRLLERKDLDNLVKKSDECRLSAEDYHASLDFEMRSVSDRIRSWQRQRDSAGYPLYFPFSTNNEYDWRYAQPYFKYPSITQSADRLRLVDAADVDNLSADELQELREIWENKLKDLGLEPCAASEPPIRLLRETTQYTPTPEEDVEKITDGIRLASSLGTLTQEQRQYANDIMDKIQIGDPLSAVERKRKERMLKKMTIDEAWYRAELKLRQDQRVNGLFALVSLPSQAPRAYFLMGEASALPIIKQCVAANGNLSKSPYSLIRVAQAKINAAKQAKGKDRKAVERAFLTAPIRLIAF